jgi:IclR family KDG regulon transcriptional repressor
MLRDTQPPAGHAAGVQSVERAFRLFEQLTKREAVRLGELARAVGLHKTTAFRILATLEGLGFVEHDAATGSYRLGIKAVEVGSRILHGLPLVRLAHQQMEALAHAVHEAVNLAMPDGTEMVYVDKVDTESMLRMQAAIGRRAPIYCTAVGKAVLAWRPDLWQRLEGSALRPLTPRTLVTREALMRDLELTRRRGYALDDEEQELGARCVAAPIFNEQGLAIAAVSISGPSARLTLEQTERVAPLVKEAARAISARLGYLAETAPV